MWSDDIKKDCRVVKTGLKGKVNLSVLESIQGQLSDGMWENSPRMEGYWKFFCLGLENDEVCIYISNRWGEYKYRCVNNRLLNKTDYEIKKWFADKIKQVVKEEQKDWHDDEIEWKRDCIKELRYFNDHLNVAQCYSAYDQLLGRRA